MLQSNSNKKEILSKAIKVFFIRVIGYSCGFVFFWIIANKYGPKIQGVFSIAFLFLAIGAMISKLGVETALIKWIANRTSIESEKFVFNKSIRVVLLSSILTGLVIYGLAPLISGMYNKPDIETSIKYAALAIPFLAILDVSSNYFKGKKQTTIFGLYFHFGKFLFPLVAILIFYFFEKMQFEVPIVSYLIGLIFVVLIITGHLFTIFKGKNVVREEQFTTRFMLSESYPMLISSSIILLMGWSDVFVLGFFVSEEKIGIYSTAIKLATVVSFIYNAIATIAAPKIANFYHQKNQHKLKETVTYSSRIMLLFSLPIFILLFLFPEFFLSIFGEEYIIGKNVLRILLLAQFTNVITGPVGPIFNMTNKHKLLQKFISIALVFNIIFSLLLVQRFELEGVAIASGLGMILWNVLGALYIYRHMEIKTWASVKK
jgi:O-antigen/teichoic acid export membrane protein